MARIEGVDLPRDKQLWIALTYIYGIGQTTSRKMLGEIGLDPAMRAGTLSEQDVARIREYIHANLHVEGDLRKDVGMRIKRLIDLGTYRGSRHRRGLPARGQRTHTNARTRKGPRKAIAGKKK